MQTMFSRLEQLTQQCGYYHLPSSRGGGNGEAFNALETEGLEFAHVCQSDSRLAHVIVPHDWRFVDDENARSANDPTDIGSVLIVADGTSIASIVAGNTDPHDYGLVLP